MTKNDLQKGYHIKLEIKNTKETIEELRSNLYNLQGIQNKERIQGGDNSPDKIIINKLGKLAELEEKLEELIRFQFHLIEEIEKIPDTVYRVVLKYRYLNNYSWEKIAEKMDVSEKTVRNKHKAALDYIEKKLDKFLVLPGHHVI